MRIRPLPLLRAFLLLAPLTARASGGEGDRPPGPPPELRKQAEAACADKASDAACTVTFGDRTLEGTCRTPHHGESKTLACMPARPPGPPPGSLEACSGKQEGAACTVETPRGQLNGTCAKPPHGDGALGCRPERPPAQR